MADGSGIFPITYGGGQLPKTFIPEAVEFVKQAVLKIEKPELVDIKGFTDFIERVANAALLDCVGLLEGTHRPGDVAVVVPLASLVLIIAVGMGLQLNKSKLVELGLAGFIRSVWMASVGTEKRDISLPASLRQLPGLPDLARRIISEDSSDKEIQKYQQILRLVSYYMSMVYPRNPHHRKLPHEAVRELLSEKKSLDVSPSLIKVLISRIGIYPVGSWVKISSGEIGRVTFLDSDHPLRPAVYVVIGPEGEKLEEGKRVDLSKEPHLFVGKPIDDAELGAEVWQRL